MVHGVDIEIGEWKRDVFDRMWANTKTVAAGLGRGAVSVATNFKDLTSLLGIPWGLLAQGAALASVGLFLEGTFRTFLMASGGTTYDRVAPSGIHPFLDPLWSTESCSFVHDGLEATKLDKLELIGRSQLALDFLRPCWARERPEYSCGRCSKCLRTIVGLRIAGALERCRTLPHTIDIDALRNVPCLTSSEVYDQWPNFLDHLGTSDEDEQLRGAALEGLTKARRYFERINEARGIIERCIQLADQFILVDQDTIRERLGAGRRVIPFLEQDGQYHGKPQDDAMAIRELERLRARGAKFMVFWWADFWWLDYYVGLRRHLEDNYRRVVDAETVIIFELGSGASAPSSDS